MKAHRIAMYPFKKLFLAGSLLVWCVLSSSVGLTHTAMPRQEMIASLNGLEGLTVQVRLGFSLKGPSQQAFQELVEQLLRDAGVPVLHQQDKDGVSFSPSLCIEVAVLKRNSSIYTYFIRESLIQHALLIRDKEIDVHVPTWIQGMIGEGTVEAMQADVKQLVGSFLLALREGKSARE